MLPIVTDVIILAWVDSVENDMIINTAMQYLVMRVFRLMQWMPMDVLVLR